jgi:thiol-disulfide isomerase/thioredoxin
MKMDNYCIALIVLILFLIYVDNQNNTEGYAEIGEKPVDLKKEAPDYGDYGGGEGDVDNEKIVQDYEVIGQKPIKISMDVPPSMDTSVQMVSGVLGTKGDYMLLDSDTDGGVYDVIGADLPEAYPRVGSPDNLGKDSKFLAQFVEDDAIMGVYGGDDMYQELDSIDDGRAEPSFQGSTPGEGPTEGPTERGPTQEGEVKVSIIYAPWCGWSKKSLPDFKKMDSTLNGLTDSKSNGWAVSAEVYDSDTPEGQEKVKEYDVEGFPTVIVEVNGQKQDGPRDYDEMMELVSGITGGQIN